MRRLHLEWMGSEGAGSVWKSRPVEVALLERGYYVPVSLGFHLPQIVCVDFDPWFIPGSTGWGPLGRGEADEHRPWGASRSKEL